MIFSMHSTGCFHIFRAVLLIVMLAGRCTVSQQLQNKDSGKFIGYAAYLVLPENAGLQSGCFSTVVAALSKRAEGKEKEAIHDLKEAVITLSSISLNDRFTYMINRRAVDSIAKRKAFESTREAFKNYNSVLYFRLFKESSTVSLSRTLQHMKKASVHIREQFSDELYKISSKSRIITHFKNVNMWAKRVDMAETLSFAFDIIHVRVSVEFLKIAVETRGIEDIASSCLGIAAGIVGLQPLVKSMASEISITGERGMTAGAVLQVCASLINFHLDSFTSNGNQSKTVNFESVNEMQILREQSKRQLRLMSTFLSNQQLGLNDVYMANQGVMPKWGILYRNDVGHLRFGASANDSYIEYPIFRKEDSSDIFLVAGKPRRISSATETDVADELEIVGFDFYGIFSKGYPYRGSTIFVNTDNINRSDYRLNGLKINTGIHKHWYHPNDQVILTDMSNLDGGEKIEITMGKGDDIIIINGVFGKFTEEFENVLHVDLGTGLNILSFEGMSADRNDIKGIFFDSKDSALSYFYGEEATLHRVGLVKNAQVLIGSPLNDYVILYGNENGNPNGDDFTVVQHSGRNFYEVSIDKLTDLVTKKRFRIIDNSDKIPTVVIRTSSPITRNAIVFVGNNLKVYKVEEKQPAVLVASIHIISGRVAIVKTVDSSDQPLLDDIASNHLGTEFVKGLSLQTKGLNEVNGTNEDDICILACEYNTTEELSMKVVDLFAGNDIVVLKDSTFIAPCHINDKDHDVALDPVSDDNEAWYLTIREKGEATSREYRKHVLKHVERIVNAFGSTVVDLSKEKRQKFDLLAEYITVTSHDMGLSPDIE